MKKEIPFIARQEKESAGYISRSISDGTIVIFSNPLHKNVMPCAVGKGLRTKVNANIGTSQDYPLLSNELKKLDICIEAKADTVMDLSTGGNIDKIRKEIIKNSPLPLGTVPIYQAVAEAKGLHNLTPDILFDTIEKQARDGVDFMTIHSGVTLAVTEKIKKKKRLMGIVSRGGAMLYAWMQKNKRENPLYEEYDRLLDILKKYNVALSLGDGLRPGSIFDSGDAGQIGELKVLGKLAKKARQKGVQVIIEGPGHVPINEIVDQMKLEKKLCHGAPFYVLGPLPTDIGAGYDHITCAIGGALAASAGADYLCYVTPAEHLGLPSADDVREGIIASRIAAHIGDIAKGVPGAKERDLEMSKARKALNWGKQIMLAIDPVKAKQYHDKLSSKRKDVCTMCGDYCAMKVFDS
ncbi:MAG: phosphomethylpyrimidine synthase ThiC [Candidatus Margulisiibacteriota bacterium]